MQRALVIGLLAAIAACGPSSSTSPGSSSAARTNGPEAASSGRSTTPAAAAEPLVVMVATPTSGQQTVSLVDANSNVVASDTSPAPDLEPVPFPGTAVATARAISGSYAMGGVCCDVELPEVSTSNRRAYFLSGTNGLRYLDVDGASGLAATLPNVKGRSQAVFAVSPDDRRIAMAVFDWSQRPMTTTISVEDLAGGNRVQIFSSNSVYEWPVVWHAGLLVVAVGSVLGGPPNPYAAISYHVADSRSGVRRASLGSTVCQVIGPLVDSGTACNQVCNGGDVHNIPAGGQACIDAADWTGKQRVIYQYQNSSGIGTWAPLSPDGQSIVIRESGPPVGEYVIRPDGSKVKLPFPDAPSVWWVDSDTVALYGAHVTATNAIFYRLSTAQVIPVDDGLGWIEGVVPGIN